MEADGTEHDDGGVEKEGGDIGLEDEAEIDGSSEGSGEAEQEIIASFVATLETSDLGDEGGGDSKCGDGEDDQGDIEFSSDGEGEAEAEGDDQDGQTDGEGSLEPEGARVFVFFLYNGDLCVFVEGGGVRKRREEEAKERLGEREKEEEIDTAEEEIRGVDEGEDVLFDIEGESDGVHIGRSACVHPDEHPRDFIAFFNALSDPEVGERGADKDAEKHERKTEEGHARDPKPTGKIGGEEQEGDRKRYGIFVKLLGELGIAGKPRTEIGECDAKGIAKHDRAEGCCDLVSSSHPERQPRKAKRIDDLDSKKRDLRCVHVARTSVCRGICFFVRRKARKASSITREPEKTTQCSFLAKKT